MCVCGVCVCVCATASQAEKKLTLSPRGVVVFKEGYRAPLEKDMVLYIQQERPFSIRAFAEVFDSAKKGLSACVC